jgi:hypothetical protein
MLQGSLRAMEWRVSYRGIEIEEEKFAGWLCGAIFFGIILTSRAGLYFFFVPIKEFYKTNICFLRKCVVESQILGKADIEEFGGFYYGWLRLWMQKNEAMQ